MKRRGHYAWKRCVCVCMCVCVCVFVFKFVSSGGKQLNRSMDLFPRFVSCIYMLIHLSIFSPMSSLFTFFFSNCYGRVVYFFLYLLFSLCPSFVYISVHVLHLPHFLFLYSLSCYSGISCVYLPRFLFVYSSFPSSLFFPLLHLSVTHIICKSFPFFASLPPSFQVFITLRFIPHPLPLSLFLYLHISLLVLPL